jgi:transposase-like protein
MCAEKSFYKFESLIELVMYFKNEKICLEYLEDSFHQGNIRCPHCGFMDPYRFKDGVRFKCKNCKTAFTAKIGTIFEKSPLPLVKWFSVMYLMANNSKGISSTNVAKLIKVRQATAWFMMHRIREAMKQDEDKLEGVVSSDEAFVGGKNGNRHKAKRKAYSAGRNFQDKVPVLGLMDKEGKVKTIVLPTIKGKYIRENVICNVKPGSILITDEYTAYKRMGKYFNHQIVNHKSGQYINKEGFSSNNIEGFWSHLKRMIFGVFHKVTPKYLQRYCDELTFRFNTRDMNPVQRLELMFTKINTRLSYKKLQQYASF